MVVSYGALDDEAVDTNTRMVLVPAASTHRQVHQAAHDASTHPKCAVGPVAWQYTLTWRQYTQTWQRHTCSTVIRTAICAVGARRWGTKPGGGTVAEVAYVIVGEQLLEGSCVGAISVLLQAACDARTSPGEAVVASAQSGSIISCCGVPAALLALHKLTLEVCVMHKLRATTDL